MPALVSVVIPNYNYGRFVRQAIDSVLGQTYPAVEVIVIDDGSTDDSLEILRSYGARIRVLQQKNQGVSRARNRGVEEGRGEFVAFLDADDFWAPDKLARQVPLLQAEKVGLVHCGMNYVDPEGKVLGVNTNGLRGEVLSRMVLFGELSILGAGSTAVVPRRTFAKVGVFDPELSTSADWDFCRRVATHFEIAFLEEPLISYRQHSTAMHLNPFVTEHDKLYSLKKTFSDPDAAAVLPLRRQSYGRVYQMLSGAYLQTGHWGRAMMFGVRAIVTWPPAARYIAMLPVRRLRRSRRQDALTTAARAGN